jgi:hypothetical protein
MNLQEAVFGVDKRIRYVGVLDEMGREIAGGMRPGVPSVEPKDEADKTNLQVALTRGMAQHSMQFLGKPNYIIIHREKLMLVAVPMDDGKTVLVSSEPDFPLERVKSLIEVAGKYYPPSRS